MGEFNETEITDRMESIAYKLRHRRKEGFKDTTLESLCHIQEIKYLFNMLSKDLQTEILGKPWLDE
tara:strand:- start:20794 stop:20991 length:198 start_codon:yes stop_codon:yes gene_type:complete